MNDMAGQRSRRPARWWRRRAPAVAVTGILLLLAYAERLFLTRIVVEFLLRLARIAG